MFDFSWSEMMIIGAVALVAIGPKDLPKALKTAGQVVRKARGLAREFHNSIDEMIRESELDEVRKSVQEATRLEPPPPPVMTGPTPDVLAPSPELKVDPVHEYLAVGSDLAAEPTPVEAHVAPVPQPSPAETHSDDEPELPLGPHDAPTPQPRPEP